MKHDGPEIETIFGFDPEYCTGNATERRRKGFIGRAFFDISDELVKTLGSKIITTKTNALFNHTIKHIINLPKNALKDAANVWNVYKSNLYYNKDGFIKKEDIIHGFMTKNRMLHKLDGMNLSGKIALNNRKIARNSIMDNWITKNPQLKKEDVYYSNQDRPTLYDYDDENEDYYYDEFDEYDKYINKKTSSMKYNDITSDTELLDSILKVSDGKALGGIIEIGPFSSEFNNELLKKMIEKEKKMKIFDEGAVKSMEDIIIVTRDIKLMDEFLKFYPASTILAYNIINMAKNEIEKKSGFKVKEKELTGNLTCNIMDKVLDRAQFTITYDAKEMEAVKFLACLK